MNKTSLKKSIDSSITTLYSFRLVLDINAILQEHSISYPILEFSNRIYFCMNQLHRLLPDSILKNSDHTSDSNVNQYFSILTSPELPIVEAISSHYQLFENNIHAFLDVIIQHQTYSELSNSFIRCYKLLQLENKLDYDLSPVSIHSMNKNKI